MPYTGELAGLATAILWAFTSLFFAEAGRLVGSFTVNKIRLLIAVIFCTALSAAASGSFIPQGVNAQQWFWLGLSGVVGLVIGDSCGFKALVMIGPRLATLIYASTPIMTTAIAWVFLGERLSMIDLFAISLTIGGISWVLLEQRYNRNGPVDIDKSHPDSGTLLKGILLALGAAVGQAAGLVLAKHGMFNAGGTVEPLQASHVRMVSALLVIWTFTAVRRQLPQALKAMRNPRALVFSGAGAFVGPFLGVWMSLVAVKYIPAGLAATLNSTTPVMILPLIIFWRREKVSLRAALGAILTVGGVALLFLHS
ncbi:MAG TPA: DMT family transporter [Candidatus Deferrimicrobium sp.]|nr:DMT family transporter [Candidatus Deferrimicrobium sp.]